MYQTKNIQDEIVSGIDTAPLKSVSIAGTASYAMATSGIIRVTGYDVDEILKIKPYDGFLINDELYIIQDVPKISKSINQDVEVFQQNPEVIQFRITGNRLPVANFTGASIKWSKGFKQAEYPMKWSLTSSSYKIDGIDQARPLNFKKHNLVLVEATTPVIISSGMAESLGGAGTIDVAIEGIRDIVLDRVYNNNEITVVETASQTFSQDTYHSLTYIVADGEATINGVLLYAISNGTFTATELLMNNVEVDATNGRVIVLTTKK